GEAEVRRAVNQLVEELLARSVGAALEQAVSHVGADEGGVVHPVATADDEVFSRAGQPGKAYARAKVLPVGLHQTIGITGLRCSLDRDRLGVKRRNKLEGLLI